MSRASGTDAGPPRQTTLGGFGSGNEARWGRAATGDDRGTKPKGGSTRTTRAAAEPADQVPSGDPVLKGRGPVPAARPQRRIRSRVLDPERYTFTSGAVRTGLTSLEPIQREMVEALATIEPAQREAVVAELAEGLRTIGLERPRVELTLKAYAGLQASVERPRSGKAKPREKIHFTASDGIVHAPPLAVRGLAVSLGLRVLPKRKHVSDMAAMLQDYYDVWMRSQEARDLHSALRRARARKQGKGPRGQHRDLQVLTDRVIDAFLGGPDKVAPVRVTWSTRAGFRVFGHHDGDVDTIVISRALDDPEVPERVLAFVLYHELLHHVMDTRDHGASKRRSVHPPAFRRRERRFPEWERCDEYLTFMATYKRPRKRANAPEPWHLLWEDDWDRPTRARRPRGKVVDPDAPHDGGRPSLTTVG